MSENLVIVESPAKTKTLRKYLGAKYKIMASYGHVRDLIRKSGAVDPDNDFSMKYEVLDKNQKHVDAIVAALSDPKTKNFYLATDPDREGEAIAWHLLELCRAAGVLKNKNIYRIAFNEITKNAIKSAIENPRDISSNLVHAQQARRVLDYLVGFELSPLLWKKVRRGLSAGRVQSPALRLVAERQKEIEEFQPKEYWSINAQTKIDKKDNKIINAKLINFENKKITQFSFTNSADSNTTKQKLLEAANGFLIVDNIKNSQRKKNPPAPFITSSLQQEAARKLGFSAQKTMRVAQQLYEGISLGTEATGLITYMRTDSTNLAQEALANLRDYINKKYGKEYLPDEIRIFKSKAKNAQEAHEAIRPTEIDRLPSIIKNNLSKEQYELYDLIWRRTLASQMQHAVYSQVAADLLAGKIGVFRANGSTLLHAGFLKIYQEGQEADDTSLQDDTLIENLLPPLKKDQKLILSDVLAEQHFTEPPPRFSEASLVKSLEEYGIGRPSTYATILSTLQTRGYAELEKKRFNATEVGIIVNKFLTKYFPQYLDYEFTARLEDQLDSIARGEEEWIPLLKKFWKPFIKLVKEIDSTVERKDVTHENIDEKCPKCDGKLSIRLGKMGRFIGCTNYPECDYTRSLSQSREDSVSEPELVADRKCPECNNNLQYKFGRYGKFIGCTNYPDCKFIESLNKPEDTGVGCPVCHQGNLVKKKSRYGTDFYSCNSYPKCRYAISSPPLNESCPKCNWEILMLKTTKRRGTEKVCPQKECDYFELVTKVEQ